MRLVGAVPIPLESREDLLGRGNGRLNIRVSVRERREARLVLARRQVHAAFEHSTVPPRKLLGVALRRVRKVVHGALREEETKHARDGAAAHVMAGLTASVQNAVDELRRDLVKVLVRARTGQDLERLDPSRHREGVATKRSRLVHRARRRDLRHDVRAAAIRADRQPTANHFAHRRHIGRDAEVLLGAAVGNAEACHDLVKDEQRAGLRRELTQTLMERKQAGFSEWRTWGFAGGGGARRTASTPMEETEEDTTSRMFRAHLKELLGRLDETRVADNGLENDGSDLMLVKQRLHAVEVVVLGHESARSRAGWHAGRVRQAKGGNAAPGLHEESVGVAVIATLKLDDFIALGVRANKTEHTHARFGARVREAHHLDRRDRGNHGLGEHIFVERRGAEARAC